jgi:NAD(P)H dehydrogenase (quinone)
LEATVIAAAIAREHQDIEAFVNISQVTVSQMTLTNMTESPRQQEYLLAKTGAELVWTPAGVHPPTVFLENPLFMNLAAYSIMRDNTIRLSFGNGRTSRLRLKMWQNSSRQFS